jgi:hypothetical protein
MALRWRQEFAESDNMPSRSSAIPKKKAELVVRQRHSSVTGCSISFGRHHVMFSLITLAGA